MRASAGAPWARPFVPEVPLVVIGSLRAGGSGKTSVTCELARRLAGRGLDVAVLAYRLARRGGRAAELAERGGDWRRHSDEALLLAETGARVFTTRNRRAAWRALQEGAVPGGRPDIILSDDGLQDPRLAGALLIRLAAEGERPGFLDLLPAGPFRETAAQARRFHLTAVETRSAPVAAVSGEKGGLWFRCRLALPEGFDGSRPWIALSALGDNARFRADLRRQGIVPVAALEAPDHGVFPLEALRRCAARHPGAGFLCTRKDAVKLAPAAFAEFAIAAADRSVELGPGIEAAIEAYRAMGPKGEIGTLTRP